jgi:hypothetical protein
MNLREKKLKLLLLIVFHVLIFEFITYYNTLLTNYNTLQHL